MRSMEQKEKQINPVLRKHTVLFLAAALLYGICFAFSFYKNFMGAAYLLAVAATMAVGILFLQKSGSLQKEQLSGEQENQRKGFFYGNRALICYGVPIFLLGISTVLTASYFMVFFNTVGILLLFAVFMLRQVYPGAAWNPGQFLCNIILLPFQMIPQVAAPFQNLAAYIQDKRGKEENHPYRKHIIVGVLIGIPMLLLVVALLNSADVIFAKYIGGGLQYLWEHLFVSSDMVWIVVLLLLGFFGSYAFLSVLTRNSMPLWEKKGKKQNPVTAVTFLAMITVVYLIFCIIQLVFLFTGGLILPAGYTYAEYAHQGFFQLLFLCMFNLLLVLLCMELFERSRLLKILLVLFSACTYVMIASSAVRMLLYIASYHLTFLRVLVLWFLALLAVVMAGVITAIVKPDFPLFQYGVAIVTVFYLLLSFVHPDYWIARYNVASIGEELEYEDISYLCGLSVDAAPVLGSLELEHVETDHERNTEGVRYGYEYGYGDDANPCPACLLEDYFKGIQEETAGMNIRTFHLSKYQAGKAADAYLKIRNLQ